MFPEQLAADEIDVTFGEAEMVRDMATVEQNGDSEKTAGRAGPEPKEAPPLTF